MIDYHRRTTRKEGETTRGLSLLDTQTSFFILVIGLAGCTVVFLLERFNFKCTRPVRPEEGQ